MTIFAQAPVPEHHRLDRGTTVRLSAAANDAPIAGHAEATVLNQMPVANWRATAEMHTRMAAVERDELLAAEARKAAAYCNEQADRAEAADSARVSAVPTPHVYASTSAACPRWCTEHVGVVDPGWTMHDSGELSVPATAGGPDEQGHVYVSVDRSDAAGQPIGTPLVRIDCTRDPMTPVEALQLAATLQSVAFAALLDVDAGRGSTVNWAMSVIDDHTPSLARRHGFTVDQAAKVQAIVTELVGQLEAEEAAAGEDGQA